MDFAGETILQGLSPTGAKPEVRRARVLVAIRP
jgi:hypothetical protein